MNNALQTFRSSARADANSAARRTAFASEFRRSLRQCLLHGFSVEECFGVIWEETLERVRLEDEQHPAIYEELIGWAQQWRQQAVLWKEDIQRHRV